MKWYQRGKYKKRGRSLYNFSPITFAQICSLTDHLLPNVRDAVEAAAEEAREGFTEASKSRKTKTILTRIYEVVSTRQIGKERKNFRA